jgi:hypothetical protein
LGWGPFLASPLAPRGDLGPRGWPWPPGVTLAPRGDLGPQEWPCPQGWPWPPWGEISPLGVKFVP